MDKAQADRIEKKLDAIIKTLHGNGSPGLKTEVAINTEYRKEIEKKKDHSGIILLALIVVFIECGVVLGVALFT